MQIVHVRELAREREMLDNYCQGFKRERKMREILDSHCQGFKKERVGEKQNVSKQSILRIGLYQTGSGLLLLSMMGK
jgi:hypothetical protein